jgi:hypothetical protein
MRAVLQKLNERLRSVCDSADVIEVWRPAERLVRVVADPVEPDLSSLKVDLWQCPRLAFPIAERHRCRRDDLGHVPAGLHYEAPVGVFVHVPVMRI